MRQITRRGFLASGVALGAACTLPRTSVRAASPNETVNLGFISCGSRGGQLMGYFNEADGANIAGVCDPDSARVGTARERFPGAKGWSDMRALLDDKGIDAVVISACNHWHCLAAIWAMEAGKDVYVEKPLSHSQWEGRQAVAAARKYGKICQLGTQQRSDPMQAEIKKFLHEDKALGKILTARVNRYGVRTTIGKRSTPLPIPKEVNYDLWLGPAQDEPIYREALHYDWHWVWNTGAGEMGNWGVHVLDDLRNNVFLDKVTLPKRIQGGGGRVVWNDAGETPNVHVAWFDTGDIPVVIGLSNLPMKPGSKDSAEHPGPGSGYIAYCEGGRLEGKRGAAVAYDSSGQVVKQFKGVGGNGIHQQNFIDAVRQRDSSILNSEVEVGHFTTGWCNLANIAFRAGGAFSMDSVSSARKGLSEWESLLEDTGDHLGEYGIEASDPAIKMSPVLEIDPRKEVFIGDNADMGNRYLKRQYREPYVVPEIA